MGWAASTVSVSAPSGSVSRNVEPTAEFGLERDRAAQRGHEAIDDRQPQTGTAPVTARRGGREGMEHVANLFRRNAASGVGHGELDVTHRSAEP